MSSPCLGVVEKAVNLKQAIDDYIDYRQVRRYTKKESENNMKDEINYHLSELKRILNDWEEYINAFIVS